MSDIVERLRKAALRGPTMEAAHTKDIRWEAADLIEHLTAELKSANEAGERIAATLRNLESALEIVMAERDIADARANAAYAKGRREALEEAALHSAKRWICNEFCGSDGHLSVCEDLSALLSAAEASDDKG